MGKYNERQQTLFCCWSQNLFIIIIIILMKGAFMFSPLRLLVVLPHWLLNCAPLSLFDVSLPFFVSCFIHAMFLPSFLVSPSISDNHLPSFSFLSLVALVISSLILPFQNLFSFFPPHYHLIFRTSLLPLSLLITSSPYIQY